MRRAQLDGQTVIVIGGSSGIGLAIARMGREAGAAIIITGRSQDRLDNARAELGDDIQSVALDCSDHDGTKALFSTLERVDHIVVTAGAPAFGTLRDLGIDEMKSTVETRLWGAVYAAKYGAERMSKGGSITFLSAPTARPAPPISPLALASCGAIEAMAQSLAVQLAPIRINTLIPGLIATPLHEKIIGDRASSMVAEAVKQTPAGRVGDADEMAKAALYLMDNEYVTGIILTVDGGATLS